MEKGRSAKERIADDFRQKDNEIFECISEDNCISENNFEQLQEREYLHEKKIQLEIRGKVLDERGVLKIIYCVVKNP